MRTLRKIAVGAVFGSLTLAAPLYAVDSLDWRHPGVREASVFESSIRTGDLAQVRAFFKQGLTVDTLLPTTSGGSLPPLALAVKAGSIIAVKLLLDEGAEPGQMAETIVYDREEAERELYRNPHLGEEDKNRIRMEHNRPLETYSPLMFAVARESHEITAELIRRGADVNQRGGAGVTALMVAAVHNKPAIVQLLLKKGADVEAALKDSLVLKELRIAWLAGSNWYRTSPAPGYFYEPKGATALWLGTLAGHVEVVARLVEAKADPSVEASCAELPQAPSGEKSCSVTRLAALLGNKEIVNKLGASGVEAAETVRVRASTPEEWRDLGIKFHTVMKRDNPEDIKPYIDGGFDINDKHFAEAGFTLLNLAAQQQAVSIVDFLIKQGADVDLMDTVRDERDFKGQDRVPHRSPLMTALAYNSCPRCAELLLQARADVNLVGNEGIAAIGFAAYYGKADILKRLLGAGADLEAQVKSKKDEWAPYMEGATPLWIAAAMGNLEGVRFLLGAGADAAVEVPCGQANALAKGETTCTPRRIAEVRGQRQVVEFLDASVTAPERAPEVDLLGPNLDRELFNKKLGALVYGGKPQIIEALLARGLDPDTMVDIAGCLIPPISLAILSGQDATLALLLSHGADKGLMSQSMTGSMASITGCGRWVDASLRGGLEKRGLVQVYTPLMYAAAEGSQASVELLLKAGADVNARGLAGKTALMIAAENNQAPVVKQLIEAGAEIDAGIENRERVEYLWPHRATALWLACKSGAADTIELLLKAGANPRLEAECRSMKAAGGEQNCDSRRIAELSGRQAVLELLDRRAR